MTRLKLSLSIQTPLPTWLQLGKNFHFLNKKHRKWKRSPRSTPTKKRICQRRFPSTRGPQYNNLFRMIRGLIIIRHDHLSRKNTGKARPAKQWNQKGLVAKLRKRFKEGSLCLWPISADMSRVVQLAASPSSPITRPPIPDIRPKACKQRRRRTADMENMTLCLELTIKQYKHFCWLQTADLWLKPAVSILTHSNWHHVLKIKLSAEYLQCNGIFSL